MSRPLAVAICAALLAGSGGLASSVSARTVPGKSVHTAKSSISCFAVLPVAGGGIECTSPYVPDIGELDSYFSLHRRGGARLSERGDYPGFSVRSKRVRDGDVWRWKGVRCAFSDGGVRCVNRDGHGFLISPRGSRRF